MIKLSIIIPCYNAEPYIYELLHTLAPQITKEVEVILIDDGSDKPIEYKMKGLKIYRQKNGGSSKARNKGLEKAKGKVIAFIDADDLTPLGSTTPPAAFSNADLIYAPAVTLIEVPLIAVIISSTTASFSPL